jgi:hypothetical protein
VTAVADLLFVRLGCCVRAKEGETMKESTAVVNFFFYPFTMLKHVQPPPLGSFDPQDSSTLSKDG